MRRGEKGSQRREEDGTRFESRLSHRHDRRDEHLVGEVAHELADRLQPVLLRLLRDELDVEEGALRGADAGIAKKEHDRIQQSLERTKAVGKEQTDLLEDIAELRREIKEKQETDE